MSKAQLELPFGKFVGRKGFCGFESKQRLQVMRFLHTQGRLQVKVACEKKLKYVRVSATMLVYADRRKAISVLDDQIYTCRNTQAPLDRLSGH